MYTITPATTQELEQYWSDFSGYKTFLQTSTWGQFRTILSEQTLIYKVLRGADIQTVFQAQIIQARRGRILLIPHGPLIKPEYVINTQLLRHVLGFLQGIGGEHKCDIVRVSPLFGGEYTQEFRAAGWRNCPVYQLNPKYTIVLDTTQSNEELLGGMKKQTRYDVRRSQKETLEYTTRNDIDALNVFWGLHKATVARHGFTPFSYTSTKTELEQYGDNAQIFLAQHKGQYVSAALFLFDQNAGYYHQGASIHCKEPASHGVIWQAIQECKRRSLSQCNLWGVSEADNKQHPWYGLSRFKRGFGGQEVHTIHAQDYPLTHKYWLCYVVERYRRWRRNY